jgi:hypothetical protein
MTATAISLISEGFIEALDETFRSHHGIYLDQHNSVFDTLEDVTAEEASRPVGGKCANLAAQVKHVRFYIEVHLGHLTENPVPNVDWDEIWETTGPVDETEWGLIIAELGAVYDEFIRALRAVEDWTANDAIAVGIAVTTHSAYHLGEIRQALCTLR